MKDNKLIALNDNQKLMSQAKANTKVDPYDCTEVEKSIFWQEYSSLVVKYMADILDELDLRMDKIRKLQS